MSVSCDPASLLQAARCLQHCIPLGFQSAIRTKLLCEWENSIAPAPPFSPDSIPGLVLWLDANVGLTFAGPNVSQWNDQSASANNFNAPGGFEPGYTANGFNGHPGVVFDGALIHHMIGAPGPAFPFSLFTVQSIRFGFTDTNTIIGCDGISTSWYGADPGVVGASQLDWFNGAADTRTDANTYANNTPFLGELLNNGVVVPSIYFNGALQTTVAISSTNSDALSLSNLIIGLQDSGGVAPFWGTLAEIIIYDSVLSAANRQLVEQYLNSKWSLGF